MLAILNILLSAIMPVISRIIPDPAKQAEAQAEITKAILENQAAIFTSMKDVMTADAASESWATRNARPFTVFWCLGMMTWVVISPIFGLQNATIASVKAIPESLWSLSAYGIGAYILGKSAVDVAKNIGGKK